MNDKGLQRKFKIEGYIKRIEEEMKDRGISRFSVDDTLFR